MGGRKTMAQWTQGENFDPNADHEAMDPEGRMGWLFGYGPAEQEGAGLQAGPPRIEAQEYRPAMKPGGGAGLGGKPTGSGAFASIMAKRGQPTGLGG